MSFFLFVFISLTWGASFILMKIAGNFFGEFSISSIRVFLGAIVLLPLWKILPLKRGLKKGEFKHLFMVSLLGYALPFAIIVYLIKKTGNSSFIGMMTAFVPLFTMLLITLFLKKKQTKNEWIGVVGGLVFLGILSWDVLHRGFSLNLLLLACVSPFIFASCNIYIKTFTAGIDSLKLACLSMLLAGFLLLIPALMFETVKTGEGFAQASVALFVLGILGTGLGGAAFFKLIHDEGPLYAGMVNYVIPIIALLFGWFDGEFISLVQMLCLAGILVMIYLVNFKKEKLKEVKKFAVASENPVKIQAAKECLQCLFEDADIDLIAVVVKTEIDEQPLDLLVTKKGAKQRAIKCFEKTSRISIGIEDGVYKDGDECKNICICYVFDGQNFAEGKSSSFLIPAEVAKFLYDENLDLEQAMLKAGLTNKENLGSQEGAIGVFSKGKLNRIDYTKQAVNLALNAQKKE